MEDKARYINVLEDIANLCRTCGSVGHLMGRCTTDVTYISIEVEPSANKVDFYSSMDNWQNPEEMKRKPQTNLFELYKTFPLGEYEFKFVVNGQWRVSHMHPIVVKNGNKNNYIKVHPFTRESYIFRSHSELAEANPESEMKNKYEIFILLSYVSLAFIEGKENLQNSKKIEVWGSWNNWASGTLMRPELDSDILIYRANKFLEPQPYYYKFRIDGVWALDPYRRVFNHDGINDHMLDISEQLQKEKNSKSRITRDLTQPVPVHFFENEELKELSIFGHTLNALGGKLYIFGGQVKETFTNTFYLFNYNTLNVQSVEMGDLNGPPAVAFHNTIVYGEKLIIFGGNNEQISKDYHTYSTLNRRWTQYKIRNNPMKREKYTIVYKKNTGRIYFFGGYFCAPDDEAETNYSDLHVLYLNVMKFSKLKIRDKFEPEPRCNHSAVLYDWTMFVFGGCQIQGMKRKIFNDVVCVDLFDHEKIKWKQVETKGESPCPRYAHACETIGSNMFIYGGNFQKDDSDIFLGDLWALDLISKTWTKIKYSIEFSIERSYSAMCAVENCLFIFGGKMKQGVHPLYHDCFMKVCL